MILPFLRKALAFLALAALFTLPNHPARASFSNPVAQNCSTTVSTSSATILAADPARRSLMIMNINSVNLGISLHGGTAAIGTNGTITLFPGGSVTFTGADVPHNAITGICASGTCQITCTEIR